jgi:hypothetical protein
MSGNPVSWWDYPTLEPIPVPLQPAGGTGHHTSGNPPLPFAGQWVYALTVRKSDVDETCPRLPAAVS